MNLTVPLLIAGLVVYLAVVLGLIERWHRRRYGRHSAQLSAPPPAHPRRRAQDALNDTGDDVDRELFQ